MFEHQFRTDSEDLPLSLRVSLLLVAVAGHHACGSPEADSSQACRIQFAGWDTEVGCVFVEYKVASMTYILKIRPDCRSGTAAIICSRYLSEEMIIVIRVAFL